MSTDDEEKEEKAGEDDDDDDFQEPEGSTDESRNDEVMTKHFNESKSQKYVKKKAEKSKRPKTNHEKLLHTNPTKKIGSTTKSVSLSVSSRPIIGNKSKR
jgi:hypothetical protein